MEQKRAEIEQMFAECEKDHKNLMRVNNFLIVLGLLITPMCGLCGVWNAFSGKPFWSFVEFFLCLYDGVITYKAIGRRSSMKKDWAECEARHRFLMEHWEEIANES